MSALVHFTSSPFPMIPDGINLEKCHADCIDLCTDLMNGRFSSVDAFLTKVIQVYPHTVNGYYGTVYASPVAPVVTGYMEVQKTLLSFAIFYLFYRGEYAQFIDQQPDPQLELANFRKETEKFHTFFDSPEKIHFMLTIMELHDLGKVKHFQDVIKALTHNDTLVDHDEILLEALKLHQENNLPQGLLPNSYNTLTKKEREDILKAWELLFNDGQTMQGESLPFNLIKVLEAVNRGEKHIVDFWLFHSKLDVAGATGPAAIELNIENKTVRLIKGCAVYNNDFYLARNALEDVLSNATGKHPITVYNDYLEKRANLAEHSIYDDVTQQQINPTKIAIARLASMSRFYTKDEWDKVADLIGNNFSPLVIDELNISGLDAKIGILPYYGPQMLVNILNSKEDPKTNKAARIAIGSQLLEKIFIAARKSIDEQKMTGPGALSVDLWNICMAINKEKNLWNLIDKEIVIDPITYKAYFA